MIHMHLCSAVKIFVEGDNSKQIVLLTLFVQLDGFWLEMCVETREMDFPSEPSVDGMEEL